MRTLGPTSPLVLRGPSRTRWARPAGRCLLLGHHQAVRRRVARPCRGAPDVSSRHALLRLSPGSSDLLLSQGCLSLRLVTPFSGPRSHGEIASRTIGRPRVQVTPGRTDALVSLGWSVVSVGLWPNRVHVVQDYEDLDGAQAAPPRPVAFLCEGRP